MWGKFFAGRDIGFMYIDFFVLCEASTFFVDGTQGEFFCGYGFSIQIHNFLCSLGGGQIGAYSFLCTMRGIDFLCMDFGQSKSPI